MKILRLRKMKKIIYLHGFGSSGATQTADYLRNKLLEVEVISPDIPLHPLSIWTSRKS